MRRVTRSIYGQYALLLALICAPLSALAESRVTLSVNRSELSIQQTLSATVEVKLEGSLSGANLDEPNWAQQGWTVVGRYQQSSMQIFNAQRSLKVTYSYQLKPIKSGTLSLGPFKGTGSASGLESERVQVKVYDGAPVVTESQKKRNKRYAIMRWESDKEELWLGERVDVTLALYVNTELRITQYLKPDLDLSGAWLEEVEPSSRSSRARLGSDIYYRKEAEHKLISPLKAGTFTLPKLSTGLGLSTLGFMSAEEEITVETPAKELRVKPLPPNPPKGFKGPAVGEIKIEALIDRTRLRVDEGVQLTVKTTTNGLLHNTPTLELPYIDGLKSFTPTLREDKQRGRGNKIVRSQTWLLKPTRVGAVEIPGLSLPYFDPKEGAYKIARTPAIKLKVVGDPKLIDPSLSEPAPPSSSGSSARERARGALKSLGVSLKSIRNEPLPLSPERDLRWLWRLVALAGLGLWLWELLGERLKALRALGGGVSLRARAHAQALTELSSMQRALHEGDALDHGRLAELLQGYLELRFQLELRGLTRDQVAARLSAVGLQTAHVEGYEALCERLDFLRFAGAERGAQRELLELSEAWLTQVDEASRGPEGAGRSRAAQGQALSLLLLGALSLYAPQLSAEPSTATAPRAEQGPHEAFWAGELKAAERGYQRLIDADPEEPNHWYNLGTTQAHQGRFGEASYSLQRGLSLAPHDQDAREQLSRVLQAVREDGKRNPGPRRLILPDEVTSGGGLLAFVDARVAESALWLSLGLLGLCLWAGRRALDEASARSLKSLAPLARVGAILMSVSCLMSAGAWYLRHSLVDQRAVGVVVEARVPLRRGPAERFPAELNVAGGVKVILQGSEGEWRRVVLFDGREGWLHQRQLKALKAQGDD